MKIYWSTENPFSLLKQPNETAADLPYSCLPKHFNILRQAAILRFADIFEREATRRADYVCPIIRRFLLSLDPFKVESFGWRIYRL